MTRLNHHLKKLQAAKEQTKNEQEGLEKKLKGASSGHLLHELSSYFGQRDWDSVRVILDLLGFTEYSDGDDGFVWGFAAAIIEVEAMGMIG